MVCPAGLRSGATVNNLVAVARTGTWLSSPAKVTSRALAARLRLSAAKITNARRPRPLVCNTLALAWWVSIPAATVILKFILLILDPRQRRLSQTLASTRAHQLARPDA
jgi:hypothetical protein